MLPAGSPLHKDIVRGAVHIVGVWILSEVGLYLSLLKLKVVSVFTFLFKHLLIIGRGKTGILT
jgi:hypothetical protein